MATKEKKQVKAVKEEKIEHKAECNDKHCPVHGTVSLRGREFTGQVVKANTQKTAVVKWERLYYLPKYERYEKRYSKLSVHSPICLNIQVGDKVRIAECRPISKTKNFVIVEKIGDKK